MDRVMLTKSTSPPPTPAARYVSSFNFFSYPFMSFFFSCFTSISLRQCPSTLSVLHRYLPFLFLSFYQFEKNELLGEISVKSSYGWNTLHILGLYYWFYCHLESASTAYWCRIIRVNLWPANKITACWGMFWDNIIVIRWLIKNL